MHNLNRLPKTNGEAAVSPVVGIMLMLVVTIIIAAVVSAFAGGTVAGTQKAPSATLEFHIRNGGDSTNSYFSMKVLGVSDPIPTQGLKITTSWASTARSDGTAVTGGNSTYAGIANVYIDDELGASNVHNITVPTGYGNGVSAWANSSYHPHGAQWGYYSLYSGTTTYDTPNQYGVVDGASDDYAYTGTHNGYLDPMQAILGGSWYNLKAGDVVTVRIIDLQSGKQLVDQKVIVEA
jgi:archaeal type IV pilus assembly protein PilA